MKLISLFVFALGFSSLAHAAGFEKAVFWSGKEAGYANSGMSRITSSESLYFNPAGLAGGEGGDVTANVSPTFLTFEAPIAAATAKEKTDQNSVTVGSAFAKYKVNERLGLGVGAYLAAGAKAIYENVALTPDSANVTLAPTIRTELKVMEYSVGAAYEFVPGLRFGAAWRISQVKGGFSTIKKTVTNTAYIFTDIADAKQTRYSGFRLGLQYEAPEHAWGVGAAYRNSVDFQAEGMGTGSQTVIPTNTTSVAAVGNSKLGTGLPAAFSIGGNYLFSDHYRLLAAVDMVKYSQNKQLSLVASFNGTALPNIPLNWKDMYNYRIGAEYTGIDALVLKWGFALTSQVTPNSDTRATLAPPGWGKTVTLGAGKSFMDKKLDFAAALEYAWDKGSGSMSATPTGSTTKELLAATDGEYKTHIFTIHAGASYHF